MRRWTFLLLCGSCFDPNLGSNPFACGPGGACPPGYSCHDGMCLSGASGPDARKNPDAPMSVVDAPMSVLDARRPDAPVSRPDARRPDAPRPHPDACSPLELFGNGDFDSSSGPLIGRIIAPWDSSRLISEPSLVRRQNEFPIQGVTTDTAPFSAVLGGANNTMDVLVQEIDVPADVQELRLSGRTWIVTDENPSESMERDVMNIQILDKDGFLLEQLAHFSNKTPSTAWTSFTVTAQSSHAGETILLHIRATNAQNKPTTFFVDTLSLVSPCN